MNPDISWDAWVRTCLATDPEMTAAACKLLLKERGYVARWDARLGSPILVRLH